MHVPETDCRWASKSTLQYNVSLLYPLQAVRMHTAEGLSGAQPQSCAHLHGAEKPVWLASTYMLGLTWAGLRLEAHPAYKSHEDTAGYAGFRSSFSRAEVYGACLLRRQVNRSSVDILMRPKLSPRDEPPGGPCRQLIQQP